MLQLGIQSELLQAVINGRKTVEGRLAKEKFLAIKPGDRISIREDFYENGAPVSSIDNRLFLVVDEVRRYDSFRQMLDAEGSRAVIPEAKNIDEAITQYRQYYSEEDEQKYGVIAFRFHVENLVEKPVKQVVKLALVDAENKYLLMYRSNHPVFGNDADLPGGTLEIGESVVECLIRETEEEAGFKIGENQVQEIYSGMDFSDDTNYVLFTARVSARPQIILSWEHSHFEWLDKPDFLEKAQHANDSYMHMVYATLSAG